MPSDFQTSMMATLAELVTTFVDEMKNKIDEVEVPDNERNPIKNSIYIDPPKEGENDTIVVDVRIPLKEAPAAAAYEWGSGLRAEQGDAEEYLIDSKDMLVFPKEDWPQYEPPPPAPNFFKFSFVMHPGVESRPYIRPTIEKMRKQFAEKLTKTLIPQILVTGHTASGRYYEVVRVVIK